MYRVTERKPAQTKGTFSGTSTNSHWVQLFPLCTQGDFAPQNMMRSIARQVCEQLVSGKSCIFSPFERVSGTAEWHRLQTGSFMMWWLRHSLFCCFFLSFPLLLQHKWLVSTRYWTRSPTACNVPSPALQGRLEPVAGRDPAESPAQREGTVSQEVQVYPASREREVRSMCCTGRAKTINLSWICKVWAQKAEQRLFRVRTVYLKSTKPSQDPNEAQLHQGTNLCLIL